MNAPDISNIESKPAVVLVSNQSEFDQLMQHLEREGNKWRGGQTPTEWKPNNFNPPLGIMIDNSLLSWHPLNWINDSIHNIIPFPDYAAKHIKPKRPYQNRVVKSKYDTVVAERDRLQAENADLKKDNDIWRKAGRETEEQKNRALAIIEKQKSEIIQSDNSWEAIISAYNALSKEVDDAKDERDLLKHKCAELNKAYHEAKTDRDVLIAKATEHAHLDSLARKLRDQRDQARFFAALFGFAAFLFGISALGLAVAVLVGRLVPVH